MKNDTSSMVLTSTQSKCIFEMKLKLKLNNNVLLLAEVGFGKSVVSLHFAVAGGFNKVIYVTQAGLIASVPTHKDLEVVPLSYSKFRCNSKSLNKKTERLALTKAKELIGDIDSNTLIVFDEADMIKGGINSQTGIVYLALRYLYPNTCFLLMSGTMVTTSHNDIIPFLMTFEEIKAKTFGEYIANYKQLRSQYVVDVPVPALSRFATIQKDINKEQLLKLWGSLILKYNKVRDGKDIKLNFKYIECKTNETTLSYVSRLKTQKVLNTSHGKSEYTINTSAYAADGVFITDKGVLTNLDNDKLVKMEKLITGKTIVLVAFLASVDVIVEYLTINHKLLKVFVFSGDMEAIEQFKACPTRCILLSTVPSLSTGYNLDEADTIIYYSVTYNTKDLIQSLGRIDRKTTTRDKTYYFLYSQLDKRRLMKILEGVNNYHSEFGFNLDLPKL